MTGAGRSHFDVGLLSANADFARHELRAQAKRA